MELYLGLEDRVMTMELSAEVGDAVLCVPAVPNGTTTSGRSLVQLMKKSPGRCRGSSSEVDSGQKCQLSLAVTSFVLRLGFAVSATVVPLTVPTARC